MKNGTKDAVYRSMFRLMPILLIITMLFLSACASVEPTSPFKMSEVIYTPQQPKAKNGAVYQAGYDVTLFEDIRAHRVGDILTVVLEEQTKASKSAKTQATKDSEMKGGNALLFGNPLSFNSPNGSLDMNLQTEFKSERAFAGGGDSSQSNKLTGNVTVNIVEVLPNGYLRIQGEKIISINQGDEYIRIAGIVRPTDIRADNTVRSTLIANAEIAYGGTGVIASANSMGWLGRIFNSKWWPF